MKRVKAKKSKLKKGLVLAAIFIGAVFMASAFSLLSTTISISGTANLYSSDVYLWRVLKSNTPTGLTTSNYDSRKASFIGASPNNYLTIDGITWRIVSVENDNTVKIICLDANLVTPFDTTNNRTGISTYCDDPSSGCNALIQKSTYTNGELEGIVENDSSVYSYLSTVYSSLSSEFKDLVAEHTFYYGPVDINSSTTLTDVLTQEASDSYVGYFGLPLLSDFIYATSNTLNQPIESIVLDNNYLTNATGTNKWVTSPVYNSSTESWAINYDKTIKNTDSNTALDTITTGGDSVDYSYVVLPVLYLKSTVKVVDGNGSSSNPFTVE